MRDVPQKPAAGSSTMSEGLGPQFARGSAATERPRASSAWRPPWRQRSSPAQATAAHLGGGRLDRLHLSPSRPLHPSRLFSLTAPLLHDCGGGKARVRARGQARGRGSGLRALLRVGLGCRALDGWAQSELSTPACPAATGTLPCAIESYHGVPLAARCRQGGLPLWRHAVVS